MSSDTTTYTYISSAPIEGDATSHSTSSNNTFTTTSNSPACAVCKYRRRRCAQDCILAPYFPADHNQDFLNVHKLFGVSNLIKVLDSVKDPMDKENAMKTMIYQANVRVCDPSRGCCRIIDNLNKQVAYYKAQLDCVCALLAFYRSKELHGEMDDQQVVDLQVVKGKNYELDSNYVPEYLYDNQLLQQSEGSWHQSHNHLNMHYGDRQEVINGGVPKNPLFEHHPFRGKNVQEYFSTEAASQALHVKSKSELRTDASVLLVNKMK